MSSYIARLGAILSLDTKEFVKGVDAAQLKSKEFKKNLRETQQILDGVKTAANATALAMLAFGAMAANTADELSDLADANDTTVGKVLELKKALVSSGGDAEKISQLFTSFTNSVDDAAQGSDKLRDAFKAVGVSTKDLGLLSSDELRQKTLKGLAQIEDSITRNALGMQFFGKAAKGVDFLKLGDEADKAAGKYDKQAQAIKSAADAAQKLELFFGDMKIAAIQAMQPVSNLINLLPSESRIEAMTKGFQVLGTTLAIAFGVKAVRGVVQLGNAIRMIAITNPWLLALTAAATVGAYVFADKLNPLPDDKEYPKAEIGGGGGGRKIEQSARDKAAANNLEKEAEKRKKELEKSKELEQDFQELLKNAYDRQAKYNAQLKEMYEINKNNSDLIQADFNTQKQLLDLEAQRHTMTENEYQTAKLNIQATEKLKDLERNASQAKLAALSEFERASSDEQVRAKEIYDAKVFYIERELEIRKGYAEQLNDMEDANLQKSIDRQKSWSAGWNEALKNYNEAAARASDRGAAAFQSVMSNMEDALRRFVDTGKFSFSELAGSIIKDLLYMEMRAKASALFSMMWNSFTATTGGSAGSIAGDLFGGKVKGNAAGGYVDSPSIVGENGAELFIPSTPGTVIPNGSWQQMAAAGSGGSGITVNGNYIASMSAIDTQSATQFLAKNKTAIWASYQSANRSVPISR
jgi:lambda family phage tail tape measure protein